MKLDERYLVIDPKVVELARGMGMDGRGPDVTGLGCAEGHAACGEESY